MLSISLFDIVFCIFVFLVMSLAYKDLQKQIDQLKTCKDTELKRFSYLYEVIETMRSNVEELDNAVTHLENVDIQASVVYTKAIENQRRKLMSLYLRVHELETLMGDDVNNDIPKDEPSEPFENPLNIVLCNTQDDEKESSAE